MSTILRALRRLERERAPRESSPPFDGRDVLAPGVREADAGDRERRAGSPDPERTGAARWLRWRVAGAAAVVLLAAGGAYLGFPDAPASPPPGPAVRSGPQAHPARAGDAAAASAAPDRRPASDPGREPAAADPQRGAGPAGPSAPMRTAPATAPTPAGFPAPAPTVAPARRPAPGGEAPAAIVQPEPSPLAPPDSTPGPSARAVSEEPREDPALAEKPVAAPARESRASRTASTRSASPPLEPVAVLPPPPDVVVRRTVWHPDADRRRALIEMEGRAGTLELREGDAVGPLVVSRIEPSGVVFLHAGSELRRSVGAGR